MTMPINTGRGMRLFRLFEYLVLFVDTRHRSICQAAFALGAAAAPLHLATMSPPCPLSRGKRAFLLRAQSAARKAAIEDLTSNLPMALSVAELLCRLLAPRRKVCGLGLLSLSLSLSMNESEGASASVTFLMKAEGSF